VAVVLEAGRHPFEQARRSTNTVLEPVDQDVGDRLVLQQRLERPQAEQLVEHLGHQAFALAGVES
jgi:hypothetical protein